MSRFSLKESIRAGLRWRPANTVLSACVGPVSRWLPTALVSRLPYAGEVTFELPGVPRLKLPTDGRDWYLSMIHWKGAQWYEPDSMRIFLRLLPGARTVLDVGANVGLYALVAAAQDAHRAVYAFEPVPRVAGLLRRNAELNGLPNLRVEECAVADSGGEAMLFVPRDAVPVAASLVSGYRPDCEEIRVRALTLDEFVRERGIARVDVLKIDVETAEPRVWAGAKKLLRRDRPPVLCECLTYQETVALRPIVSELEYEWFSITPKGLAPKSENQPRRAWEFNDLFLPRERAGEWLARCS